MYINSVSQDFRRRFVMLGPRQSSACGDFRRASRDYSLYRDYQSEMQKLRGRLYLQDGAIDKSELASDGRHILETDDESWHLLTLDAQGTVVGCICYLQHSRGVRFDDLRASEAALADSDQWGAKLRAAVEDELATARLAGFTYVEVGGWAMAPEVRGTTECLRTLLATYAWSRMVGGALGLSTATERNGSASILRRIGGHSIQWDGAALPPYFDPRFNCQMQILRFDSRCPNPKYEDAIENVRRALVDIPVICQERPEWQTMVRGFSSMAAPFMQNGAMAPTA